MTHPEPENTPCKYGHVGERSSRGACKICARIRAKQWAIDNPDKIKARVRGPVKRPKNLDPQRPCPRGHIGDRYSKGQCRACMRARAKEWKSNNLERKKIKDRESRVRVRNRDLETAREKERVYRRLQYARNPAKVLAWNAKWKAKNIDMVREKQRQSRLHRDHTLRAAEVALRRARKKQATPIWADLQRIKEIYKRANRLGKCLGIKVQIDHIVPLQSDFVCGLHVPWNLQILSAKANVEKSNLYWPDMTNWSL